MIKQQTILEVAIAERVYQLVLPAEAPIGEIHDALLQMKGYMVDRMIAAQREEQMIADSQKEAELQEE